VSGAAGRPGRSESSRLAVREVLAGRDIGARDGSAAHAAHSGHGGQEAVLALQALAGNRGVAALMRGGRPLDAALGRRFGRLFAADFRSVRLDADVPLPPDVLAVTVGEHIGIGPAARGLDPGRSAAVLAHELAHVVQHRRGACSGTAAAGSAAAGSGATLPAATPAEATPPGPTPPSAASPAAAEPGPAQQGAAEADAHGAAAAAVRGRAVRVAAAGAPLAAALTRAEAEQKLWRLVPSALQERVRPLAAEASAALDRVVPPTAELPAVVSAVVDRAVATAQAAAPLAQRATAAVTRAAPPRRKDTGPAAASVGKRVIRDTVTRQLGRAKGVALEAGNVVDVLIGLPATWQGVAAEGINKAQAAGVVSAEQADRARAITADSAAGYRVATAWAQQRGVVEVDPVTGAPSVSPVIGRQFDDLAGAAERAAGPGTAPESALVFTEYEAGELEGAVGSQVALGFVGVEEVQLALKVVGALGSVRSLVEEMQRDRGWRTSVRFWTAVLSVVMSIAGLRNARASGKLVNLVIAGGGLVLAVAPLARLYEHWTDPALAADPARRETVLKQDFVDVVKVVAQVIVDVVRQAGARTAAGRPQEKGAPLQAASPEPATVAAASEPARVRIGTATPEPAGVPAAAEPARARVATETAEPARVRVATATPEPAGVPAAAEPPRARAATAAAESPRVRVATGTPEPAAAPATEATEGPAGRRRNRVRVETTPPERANVSAEAAETPRVRLAAAPPEPVTDRVPAEGTEPPRRRRTSRSRPATAPPEPASAPPPAGPEPAGVASGPSTTPSAARRRSAPPPTGGTRAPSAPTTPRSPRAVRTRGGSPPPAAPAAARGRRRGGPGGATAEGVGADFDYRRFGPVRTPPTGFRGRPGEPIRPTARATDVPPDYRIERVSLDRRSPHYWNRPGAGVVPQPGVALEFPNGVRVWRAEPDGPILHDAPLGPSIGRAGAERAHYSAGEHGGLPPGPQYQRAHSLGQGTGFESPYGIYYAPAFVNLTLQNGGIESYLRSLAARRAPGEAFRVVTTTSTHPGSRRLSHVGYRIEGIVGGQVHEIARYEVAVAGTAERPVVRARAIQFADNPLAREIRATVPQPPVITRAVTRALGGPEPEAPGLRRRIVQPASPAPPAERPQQGRPAEQPGASEPALAPPPVRIAAGPEEEAPPVRIAAGPEEEPPRTQASATPAEPQPSPPLDEMPELDELAPAQEKRDDPQRLRRLRRP
jgi:hypothetical protein